MATNMAKAMVTQYGMSEEMGPLAYGENEQEVFLGHSVARQQNMSEETQCKIDAKCAAWWKKVMNRPNHLSGKNG